MKDVTEQVRLIDLRTRGLVENALAGDWQSAMRGRGIDFDQVREYVPGDDVRAIDWNVTARAGRPFIKEFREERELRLMLLVDVSASGAFGSGDQHKCELAAELACVLAMSAARNNDRVGLILFSDRIEGFVPPGKGRQHVLRVVREILTCEPRGTGTDISAALQLAGSILHRRSLLFVISDLELGVDRQPLMESLSRVARPLGLRHDAVALRVFDPRERELPNVGLVAVEDAETGDVVQLDTGRRKVRERYAQVAAERAAALKRRLRRANFEGVEGETARSYVATLLGDFKSRERRVR